MTTILLATGNPGKQKEMLSFFGKATDITWLTLRDLDPMEEPIEDGENFTDNALIKAKYYAEQSGHITLAEDSGFILDAYPDKFGVRTRRQFEAKDDIDWLRQFLEMMEKEDNRMAAFHSAMTLYDPHAKTHQTVEGITRGEIAEFPMAPIEKGIPVSAVFTPDGHTDVYSAMSNAQKNKVSHRGKACRQMADILMNW